MRLGGCVQQNLTSGHGPEKVTPNDANNLISTDYGSLLGEKESHSSMIVETQKIVKQRPWE